jgi:hypothetical protein
LTLENAGATSNVLRTSADMRKPADQRMFSA